MSGRRNEKPGVSRLDAPDASGAEPDPIADNEALAPNLRVLAHELRTPLSAIVTLAELLRDAPDSEAGGPRYRKYADDVRESALHALSIVAAALEREVDEVVAQAPGSGAGVPLQTVDLTRVSERIVSAMAPVALQRGIVLSSQAGREPICVATDVRFVRQILFNLVANALRFTPRGGQVCVAAERDGAGRATLIVSDTGVGFGNAEPDAACAASSKSGEEGLGGTGIGLVIVQHLAQAAGAHVAFKSQSGAGTKVSVVFGGGADRDGLGAGDRSSV